jgi:cytochrome c oxidase cbb3-type subunit 3
MEGQGSEARSRASRNDSSSALVSFVAGCAVVIVLAGCSAEKRAVGPAPPATAPTGVGDIRQKHFETNRFEQAEGGRLFRWAGCGSCHTESASGAANLSDDRWEHGGSVAEIYQTIASGAAGPGHSARFTPQELWQISGYLKALPKTKPNMRRRNNAAQAGEPSGAKWAGALR